MLDVLAIGEPMMELSAAGDAGERMFRPGFGGDTSNCVVAAARQGAKVGYLTHVGDDAFGHDLLDLWDRETVDRSAVVARPGMRTGIYFIDYGPEGHRFSYYRAGSAASAMRPADIDAAVVAGCRVLHASGISQAIGDGPCDAVFRAMRIAKEHGRLVSYDTNLRLPLWPLDRARAVIHAAAAVADILLPGLDDARQLLGVDDPSTICDRYLRMGPKVVALTLGAEGCVIATRDARHRLAPIRVEALDATGAGDTFDGAFLAEYLRTEDAARAGRYANAAAAMSTRGWGAVAPMPRRAEVEAFLAAMRNG